MSIPNLWLDGTEAWQQVSERAKDDTLLQRIGEDIIGKGFAIIPGLIPEQLCDDTVVDFARYVDALGSRRERFKDQHGRYLRLVNFHLHSDNARSIGLNPQIMNILDFLFGMKACIYTSLYFEYGTQQPIHRDSPFFETFPRNYFLGVWVALENIDPDSGPLMYVPGGHRFECDPHEIYQRVLSQNPNASTNQLVGMSLETYYGQVMERSSSVASPEVVPLRKGDVAIWHPLTPHGGSPAQQPHLTRRSIVFHCSPEALQVYQHKVFFSHNHPSPPPPRYRFMEYEGRKVALAGDTAFQLPG